MAPRFVSHIFAWMQSGVFIVTEIMYAPRLWAHRSNLSDENVRNGIFFLIKDYSSVTIGHNAFSPMLSIVFQNI